MQSLRAALGDMQAAGTEPDNPVKLEMERWLKAAQMVCLQANELRVGTGTP